MVQNLDRDKILPNLSERMGTYSLSLKSRYYTCSLNLDVHGYTV